MTTIAKSKRRSSEDWARLIKLQEKSTLSVKAFCRQHQFSDVTFYHWRKRLKSQSSTSDPLFVELETSSPSLPVSTNASDWNVELTLGPGMILRVRC